MRQTKLLLGIILLGIMTCCIIHAQVHVNLKKIIVLGSDKGYASLNSTGDTLLVSYSKGIYWYRNRKKIKDIKTSNMKLVKMSPDGKYYSYVLNDIAFIKDQNDKLVAKISGTKENYFESTAWSYDSRVLYFCQHGMFDKICSYDIATGISKEILRSKRQNQYFNLVTVKNKNLVYLLEDNSDPNEPGFSVFEIIQYSFLKKELKKVILPNIKNFAVTGDFTISPNEKIIMCNNIWDESRYLYVIDQSKEKVIDKIKTPPEAWQPTDFFYSWKSDSSYVIFTITGKEIYQYTVHH